jgi:hypothetical protein
MELDESTSDSYLTLGHSLDRTTEPAGEILLTARDKVFARGGRVQIRPYNESESQIRPRQVDGTKELYDLDQSLLFGLDTGWQRVILEP